MTWTDSVMDLLRVEETMRDVVDAWATDRLGRTVNPIPFDLAELPDALVVRAYLPGFRREDVSVEVRDHRLAIKAERRLPQRDDLTWLHVESPYGLFLRTIELGTDVLTDQIEAAWQDGVLTIRLPRAEAARPRRIPIMAGAQPALEEPAAPQGC
jgi:HSP20 family protein